LAERLALLARPAILARSSLDLPSRGFATRQAERGAEVAERHTDLRRSGASATLAASALVSWAALVLAEVVAAKAIRSRIGRLARSDWVLVGTVASEALDGRCGPVGVATARASRHARARRPA
jgi:hypothetical protein